MEQRNFDKNVHIAHGTEKLIQDETETNRSTIRQSKIVAKYLERRCGPFLKNSPAPVCLEKIDDLDFSNWTFVPSLSEADIECLYQKCIEKAVLTYCQRYKNDPFARNEPETLGVKKIHDALIGLYTHFGRMREILRELAKSQQELLPSVQQFMTAINNHENDRSLRFDHLSNIVREACRNFKPFFLLI